MAFNKAKALQEAQKYVTQGKTARAIKEYQSIAEKDPGDITLLNAIGDLYTQENNFPEALKYFYKVAEAYSREGYKVKAIAIYKKIAKLDRNAADPMLRLAELSAGVGLAREAREHYRSAFEFFEKAGQKDKALGVLRELCQLDPSSPSLRLKLAEFAEDAGESLQALDVYLEAATLAHQQGDATTAETALNRAAQLAPENPKLLLYRARHALNNQRPDEVQAVLGSADGIRSNPEAQCLLLDSHLAIGNVDAAKSLLLDVFRTNPRDFSPVSKFAARCVENQRYDAALEVLTSVATDLIERRDTGGLLETLRTLSKSAPERVDILELTYMVAEKSADEGAIPEILDALGKAYGQSNDLEKAQQTYARLAALEPENETYKSLLRQVLERQGKEYAPLGQTPSINADPGPEIRHDSAIDNTYAASSQGIADEASVKPGPVFAWQDEPPEQNAVKIAPQPPALLEFDPLPPVEEQETLEEKAELPPPQEISLEFHSPPPTEQTADTSSTPQDDHPSELALPGPVQHEPAQDEAHIFKYEESREEIEFYIQYGFYDAARKCVSELERKFPEDVRVADLRQRVTELSQKTHATGKSEADAAQPAEESQRQEWELPTSFSEPGEAGNGRHAAERHTFQQASTFQDAQGAAAVPAISNARQGNDVSRPSVQDASAELGSLLDELSDDGGSIDRTADDDQTHYNLGVAFREMGLLDEAIGEFQKVVKGNGQEGFSPYFLQGCTLLASCFMDKGMPTIATRWYSRALEAPGLDHEGMLALYYDMGIALEKSGNIPAALEKFTEVYSLNIDYRDVAEKIRLLRQITP